MHDPTTTTGVEGLRMYEGGELVFDGSDPTTYTVRESAAALGPWPKGSATPISLA